MSDLKPCPFCGNKMGGYPDYTISFKRDRRKIHGIYYEVCTLHCNRCSCTIQQAGATREEAEKHAYNVWNRRMSFTQPETHEKRTETHARDCVSGVAAIIAAIEAVDEWDGGYNVQRANMIRDAIKALPSAQPRRLNGEWIEDGYNHYKAVCSECGEPCATYIMGKPRDKYCKWCGADMRGEDDET